MTCSARLLLQGDAEDRRKLRQADKAKQRELEEEREMDETLMEAEEMANMGLRSGFAPGRAHPGLPLSCSLSFRRMTPDRSDRGGRRRSTLVEVLMSFALTRFAMLALASPLPCIDVNN